MNSATTDLRGLLHYVPQFRGKLFAIDLDWSSLLSENAKAEVVMDLSALQTVGVKLLLVMNELEREEFLDWSVDLEFRAAHLSGAAGGIEVIKQVMNRGQAVLVDRVGSLLSDAMISHALSLDASKIIVLSDCEPVTKEGEVVKFLRVAEMPGMGEGMSEKDEALLQQAASACSRGVKRVHLLNANIPGVLLDELFSNEGVGTMVYTDRYRQIRPLKEEDISELLGMIGRSVRNTHLVPRTYEDIADQLDAYAVMEVDDNVVGCVALYQYGDIAEIACLYVKQSHGSTGYGADLVHYMEKRAKELGMPAVFALTNRAAVFFKDRLGYEEMEMKDLPEVRRKVLQSSGRNSQAFKKIL